jgi:hypothetical protein
LRALEPSEIETLAPYAEPDVRNVAGRVVGVLKATSPT